MSTSSPGKTNFYPRSPRGERRPADGLLHPRRPISIHAPREGSDIGRCASVNACHHFYPRSPRGERPTFYQSRGLLSIFLSTLPARGATSCSPTRRSAQLPFLSTLPARGATPSKLSVPSAFPDFYPRSPRGERRPSGVLRSSFSSFLSTLPARGATCRSTLSSYACIFLSTLPARGATAHSPLSSGAPRNFYPRSPRGERQTVHVSPVGRWNFYPRSPRGERRPDSDGAYTIV